MPFTPYHFGPSGFMGLALRKWIDVPVFVLANVIVDLEVLLVDGWPIHRYFHTLLIGTAVGAAWGIAAYAARPVLKWAMRLALIPYQTSFLKMIISGILGVWLHVFFDAIYHWDVRIFWPGKAKPLYKLLSKGQVETVCVAFFVAAIILYIFAVIAFLKKHRTQSKIGNKKER